MGCLVTCRADSRLVRRPNRTHSPQSIATNAPTSAESEPRSETIALAWLGPTSETVPIKRLGSKGFKGGVLFIVYQIVQARPRRSNLLHKLRTSSPLTDVLVAVASMTPLALRDS